jgi:hypothetical protein
MSLCQGAHENDDSIIDALDDLKKKQKEKRNDKKRFEQIKPSGRKDWPSAVMYVLGNVFQITFRNITEHSDCVLVIPYEDTSMSLYPGTIVNRSEIDYREKLESRTNELKPGSVYTQDNYLSKEFLYHCIAFVKIDKEPETIDNALKYIFETVERLQKKFSHLKHLVIPLSLFSYHADKYSRYIKKVITQMYTKKFKSVTLTTKDKDEWQKAMVAFMENTVEMINKNELGA